VHTERLASKILPPPYQLDPLLGSYYSNASGLFRGDVRYYNFSSIPYDTNVTWKPISDRLMESANLSAISERLGTWNWSAAESVGIKVHDRVMTVTNVSESVAIFQVLYSLFHHTWCVSKITFRARLSCSTQGSRIPSSWSLMEYTSRKTVPSTRLLKRKGLLHDVTHQISLFDLLLVLHPSTCGISQASFLSVRRTLPRWFCKTR